VVSVCERFNVAVISRIEFPTTSPREISSRSESVNAKDDRFDVQVLCHLLEITDQRQRMIRG